MKKTAVQTTAAPAAIGTYSQAIRVRETVYISGQIPLDPVTGEMISGDIHAQIRRVFDNLAAVAEAAGMSLDHAVKITVYLTDLNNFAAVNEVMKNYFQPPYPARAAIGVTALPKNAAVEADAILAA
jgi:reactive intermediate/imine deaminase